MQMKYNIYIELASIVYVGILCIYQQIQYSNQLEVNRAYKKLAWTVLAAVCMDVLTAITISYAQTIPTWLNMILNTAYFELDSVIVFYFARYVCTYVYEKEERRKLLQANNILHGIYLCILILNLTTGWVFSFDPSGAYIHGPIYLIVYIMPFYYLIFTLGILIKNWQKFQKKQQVSMMFFALFVAVGPLVQLIFLPDILVSVFTSTIGLIIIHYSLETPDFQRLMETLEELKAAEAQAQEANRVKDEFLANMSHELRTPINAILGFNEMLMKETQEEQTAECASKIQASGRILTSIVSDVLDFTSIDKGSLELEIKPYDTMSLLQDVTTYAEFYAEKKGLAFRMFIDEALPQKLSGDAVRLTQILNNLISNAVKFTKEGYIRFAVSWQPVNETNGNLCIQVSDSGIGMHKEDVEKLAEFGQTKNSFQRFDNRNTRNIQGIGLGLTIVTRLLALMESRLAIESEYNKGSDFSFEVLQEIVNAEPIGKTDSDRMTLPDLDRKTELFAPNARLLVVDDNTMNLDMFKGLLKQTKIQIDTALNGEESLQLLKKNQYDIIFLDHMMPVMDGIETLQEMRRRNICSDTPVIALTANAVAGAKDTYLTAGFEDYLSKPVKGSQLEDTIKKYLPPELIVTKEAKEDGSAPAAVPPQSFLERLSFLDTATGMAYCCESEDFYREMLSSYLGNNRKEELEKLYEQEDWENYRISVHALKSTSLSIGAVDISEQAKAMEQAAKENDISYIKAHQEGLMKDYQTILTQLNGIINEQTSTTQTEESVQSNVPQIFAVDDDPMNLQIIRRILADEFAVSCFESGEELFHALTAQLPDMLLLDIRMPQMDGFAVLKLLKESTVYNRIPVIFLTADDDRDTEIRGFEEGVLDFIHKPFAAEIMMQRVKRIMQLDRLQKNLQSEVEKQTGELVAQKDQIERLSVEIIQTLASTIDAKDKYTNGHSSRVAEYARAIARRAGKTEKEVNDIYITGLLHDIGKIGIPDSIINKPDKLNDQEYSIIRTHPAIGANILSNVSAIPDIATGAHWHHERYDGRGYPDGLKGTAIPEMARIIGVADTYDAMTSKRSYRNVLPQEAVRDELIKSRGTQLDPFYADIMLSLMAEDTEYQLREL